MVHIQFAKISNVNKRKLKGEQAIDAEEFVQFYHLLLIRPEIETLFRKSVIRFKCLQSAELFHVLPFFCPHRYAEEDGGSMSPNGLRLFLEKEQSMKDVNAEMALGLIRRFDPSPSKEMGRMTLTGIRRSLSSVEIENSSTGRLLFCPGFTALMTSTMFDVLDGNQRQVIQDMTRPLSHYFIASSHNT